MNRTIACNNKSYLYIHFYTGLTVLKHVIPYKYYTDIVNYYFVIPQCQIVENIIKQNSFLNFYLDFLHYKSVPQYSFKLSVRCNFLHIDLSMNLSLKSSSFLSIYGLNSIILCTDDGKLNTTETSLQSIKALCCLNHYFICLNVR